MAKTRKRDDLAEFLAEVQAESVAAGDEEAFKAYGEHFELARQIIELRLSKGWTQAEWAKRSGVQQSEISRIERGQGNPTYVTLTRLAGSVGRPIVVPAHGQAEPPPAPKRTSRQRHRQAA